MVENPSNIRRTSSRKPKKNTTARMYAVARKNQPNR